MRLRISFLLLLPVAFFVSCSGAETTPTHVAQRFFSAVRRGDAEALRNTMTPVAFEEVQGGEGFHFDGHQVQSFTLGEEQIAGERAHVEAQLVSKNQPQDLKLLLRRSGGEWRIHGMSVSLAGTEMALDFEQSANVLAEVGEELGQQLSEQIAAPMLEAFEEGQKTWQQGGTEEEITAERARFQSLVAVSATEHESAWRIDVDGREHSALAVLRALVEPSGLSVVPGEHAALLDQPCSYAARGVSRIEAVEGLCASIGIHPLWPEAKQQAWEEASPPSAPLTFRSGPRALPAVPAGPFLVEVTRLIENTLSPTGEIGLAVRALGLAPGVLAFQGEMFEILHLESLCDALGEPLTDLGVSVLSTPEVRDGYFTYGVDRELVNLLRGVERIETLGGEIRLRFPTEMHSKTLHQRDKGPIEVAGGTLEVTSWGSSPRMHLRGVDVDSMKILFSPLRSDGEPLGMQFQYSQGWSGKLEGGVDCPQVPAAIEIKVCSHEELVYEFAFPPIPFRGFSERPLKLETLRFSGAAPLVFSQTAPLRSKNGMSWLRLEIENPSNKDVVTAMVRFTYLDGEGAALGDFPHTLNGDYDFDLQGATPLVRAGQTRTQDAHAAFVPEGVARVRFELLLAEFADGSRWEP